MNQLERVAASRFRERLEALLGEHLLDMRLFGSRARGDAGPDSDLDVFVLFDGDDPLRAVVTQASQVALELELPFCISPLVMERAHYERLCRTEALLARELAREGIAV